MQRSRKQWQEVVPYRLDDVYEGVIRNDRPSAVIRSLHTCELTSEHYDLTCLAVDVWYLFDKRATYRRKYSTIEVIREPLFRVFFSVVVQSLQDVVAGRPCDVNSWKIDHPPAGEERRCSPSTHICAESALDFILETGSLWESVLNLPHGILVNMATKENGSVGSRSQAILNYTGQ